MKLVYDIENGFKKIMVYKDNQRIYSILKNDKGIEQRKTHYTQFATAKEKSDVQNIVENFDSFFNDLQNTEKGEASFEIFENNKWTEVVCINIEGVEDELIHSDKVYSVKKVKTPGLVCVKELNGEVFLESRFKALKTIETI